MFSRTQVGDAPQLLAGGNLNLNAHQDIRLRAAQVTAGQHLSATAGRDILITSATEEEHFQQNSRNRSDRVSQIASTLTAGGRAVFNAGRDMSVLASHITACDTRSSLNPP
jgi:filamentous hemagglutinin